MSVLAVEGLAVSVGGRPLIECASFVAGAGDFIGIVGPNGAGKSTMLRAVAGLAKPAAGYVFLDGASLESLGPRELARRRSYLPQQRDLAWSFSVEAVVALGRFAYGSPQRMQAADHDAVDRALAAVGLSDLRTRDAFTLSGGETARMHLARALAADTPLVLADEPTASLDLRHQLEIMAAMKSKADSGGIVLAAIHDLNLAMRFCNRLIIVQQGRLIADGPPETVLTSRRLAEVFGVSEAGRSYGLVP